MQGRPPHWSGFTVIRSMGLDMAPVDELKQRGLQTAEFLRILLRLVLADDADQDSEDFHVL
jgi:hypothetical protein